jgi:hypothetical protein
MLKSATEKQNIEPKRKAPVYNDRLSVLDFRPRKRKSALKLSERAPDDRKFIEYQMPSPMSTTSTSGTLESSRTGTPTDASPIDPVAPESPWDDVDSAPKDEDVQWYAMVLIDAVGDVSSDEGDESEVLGAELDGDDHVSFIAESKKAVQIDSSKFPVEEESSETQEVDEEDLEEPAVAFAIIEDDETDDDWRPAYKPKSVSSARFSHTTCNILTAHQMKPSKEQRKPRARRKLFSLDTTEIYTTDESDDISVTRNQRTITPRRARSSKKTYSQTDDSSFQADVPADSASPKQLGRLKKKPRVRFEV